MWQIIREEFSKEVEDLSDVTIVSSIIETSGTNKLLSFDYPTAILSLRKSAFWIQRVGFRWQMQIFGYLAESDNIRSNSNWLRVPLPTGLDSVVIRVCNRQSFTKQNHTTISIHLPHVVSLLQKPEAFQWYVISSNSMIQSILV